MVKLLLLGNYQLNSIQFDCRLLLSRVVLHLIVDFFIWRCSTVARFVFNCIKWCMQLWIFITVISSHFFGFVHLHHPLFCNLSCNFTYFRCSATKFPSWMDTDCGAAGPSSFQKCSSTGKVMVMSNDYFSCLDELVAQNFYDWFILWTVTYTGF